VCPVQSSDCGLNLPVRNMTDVITFTLSCIAVFILGCCYGSVLSECEVEKCRNQRRPLSPSSVHSHKG